MDKKELILRKLSTVALNNKIVELNNIIETHNDTTNKAIDKSKQFFTELAEENKRLSSEISDLQEKLKVAENEIENLNYTLQYQKSIIEKVPRFLLKYISKKNRKLLNKGN